MEFKQLVIACIVAIGICSCNQPTANNNEKVADTAVNAEKVAAGNYLDSFKQTKDERLFLTRLYGEIGRKAVSNDGRYFRLLKMEEVDLYGSTKPLTLVYVDSTGKARDYYNELIILNDTGQMIYLYPSVKFDLVHIFEREKPFLVLEERTLQGYGSHRFFGVDSNANLKDFLDEKDWALLTTDAKDYTPKILPYVVKEVNGQKEIAFTGKWKNKPFTLTFVWNNKSKMFEEKKN